ncbi:MAG: hypothetical protein QOH34_3442, partial [Mycobacterium sp.]|nr:hypothetical protein [Mycobacterium sp.]
AISTGEALHIVAQCLSQSLRPEVEAGSQPNSQFMFLANAIASSLAVPDA